MARCLQPRHCKTFGADRPPGGMTRVGPKRQDYAAIGDGRSAALVSRDGSMDWLCWPRFDSPSLFASILDRGSGGSWRIAPTRATHIERHYLSETNVLETRFHTATGIAAL